MRVLRFELYVRAEDTGNHRERWNGGPLASREASAALHEAVEAFNEALRARGFEPARASYGVVAKDVRP